MKIILTLLLLIPTVCVSGEILSEFPSEINANDKFVFYSHGYIVEGDNPTPAHPRWGVYDFPKIKEELSDSGYRLIAYHRPKNIDALEFAQKMANDVLALIDKGVKPSNIALVGFSRGGAITILTSKILARNDINYVILAACGNYVNQDNKLFVYGEILSIIETSDNLVGSCQPLIDRSDNVTSFEEIEISTGKEHGAFYVPLAIWLAPVKQWIKQGYTQDNPL